MLHLLMSSGGNTIAGRQTCDWTSRLPAGPWECPGTNHRPPPAHIIGPPARQLFSAAVSGAPDQPAARLRHIAGRWKLATSYP